jgi:hypothetical protein
MQLNQLIGQNNKVSMYNPEHILCVDFSAVGMSKSDNVWWLGMDF